jgi:hypothetical protein
MYKLIEQKTQWETIKYIHRLSDDAGIPIDPANSDYAEYLRWLAEGNTPHPLEENT